MKITSARGKAFFCTDELCWSPNEKTPDGSFVDGEFICDGCIEDLQDFEQEEAEVRGILAELGQRS